MGIRFYCPNGHKLNVKEFQAGRRGICPFCGARTQIPTQSTRPSSKSGHRAAAAHTAVHDDDDEQASDSSPDILPGEPPSLPGDPGYQLSGDGKMLGPSTAPDTPSPGPVTAPPATSAARPQSAATRPSAPFPSVDAVLAAPPSPAAGPASKPSPGPTAMPSRSPTPALAPSASPGAVRSVTPQAAPTEPPDPIADAPEMIWYIRPPTGGQFGPAPGEMMRTWLGEGRVSADSLVWREGWHDWQEAGTVFPKLRNTQLMDLLETASAAPIHPAGRLPAAPPAAFQEQPLDRPQPGDVIGSADFRRRRAGVRVHLCADKIVGWRQAQCRPTRFT